MRKIMKMVVALSCAATVTVAVSCSHRADKPEFGRIAQTENLVRGDKNFEIDYSFEYLVPRDNDPASKAIRDSMTADFFGRENLKNTPEDSAGAFVGNMSAIYGNYNSDEYAWNGFVRIKSDARLLNDHIVVYTVERSEYMGGAHGMETTLYSNYDLRTGRKLTLADLFTPEGIAALQGKICDRILEIHGKKGWNELTEAGNCYTDRSEIKPTGNFELSGKHITFLYNPYEIACYAQGQTSVSLAYDELEGFRKAELAK